jgi:putative hydrolase of the HAD superfamily
MIRNIIFDLGNVLLSFKPAEYLKKSGYPENKRKLILSDIFGSPEWQKIDQGFLTAGEAIELISARSSLRKGEISQIFENRTAILYSIDSNVKLLPGLKKEGFRLYFLSNFPMDIFNEVKTSYSFFRLFDGGIISAEARSTKPDPAIYHFLLEKYGLTPEDCLFIDDLEENVSTAVSLGINGITTHGARNIGALLNKYLLTCKT